MHKKKSLYYFEFNRNNSVLIRTKKCSGYITKDISIVEDGIYHFNLERNMSEGKVEFLHENANIYLPKGKHKICLKFKDFSGLVKLDWKLKND